MLALAYVDDRLFDAGIDGGPVAWLHDEIVIEVREDQAERAAEILKQSMIDGFAETFPGAPLNGLVEPHIGLNWGEAKAKPATPVTQNSSQQGEIDYRLIYETRLRLIRGNYIDDSEEPHLRAREHAVNVCRANTGLDLEQAKMIVLAAIARAKEPV